MTGLDAHISDQWSLATFFGYEHPFFIINTETVVSTWALLALLAVIACLLRFLLYSQGHARFMVLTLVSSMIDLTKQSLGIFDFNHFAFIATLFVFIAFSNTLSIIPWLDEPTNDINTTLALGIISFLYIQHAAIAHTGLKQYIKEYFSPIFIMFPLNLVGKLSSIISLSFRLFGNIAGGAIIMNMYLGQVVRHSLYTELTFIGAFSIITALVVCLYKKLPLAKCIHIAVLALFFSPNMLMTLFFGIFEGFLQAFVFTMLSLTYLASALQGEGH